MIDLHAHTTASDGTLAPAALVALAVRTGLSALAITDHDSVAGVPEALAAARTHTEAAASGGNGVAIRCLPGVEIEISFDPGEFHLLGLGIDPTHPSLVAALASMADSRRERNLAMIDLMRSSGIEASIEEISAAAGTSHLGRPHLADHLVRKKAARNRQDAFDRFLGKGRPFYMPKECLPLAEALRLIRVSGGAAYVAHPYSLFVSKSKLGALMDDWKDMGIEGIEAYHPTAKLGQCRILEKMARERGFAVSAGSDFHGPGRPECGLGRTAGGILVPDSMLAELDAVLPGRAPEQRPGD